VCKLEAKPWSIATGLPTNSSTSWSVAAAALIAAFSYLMVQCLELTSCLVGVCVEIKLQAPHAIGTMLSLSDHCVSLTG
jgi:hypothetical protein